MCLCIVLLTNGLKLKSVGSFFKGGCGNNAGTGIQSYVTRQTPGNYVLSAVFQEAEKKRQNLEGAHSKMVKIVKITIFQFLKENDQMIPFWRAIRS